jgi:ABC-2 type transport system permease protein
MRAFGKLFWVELKLFAREPLAVIFAIAFPFVMLITLSGVFGEVPSPEYRGVRPADYYVSGHLALVIGAIGLIALPVHIAAYRERGVLRRFRASPLPPWAAYAAPAAVGLVVAAIGAVVMVVTGRLLYDAALPDSPGMAILMFVFSAVAFLALGFLLAGVARTTRAAQAVGMLAFFPMWLLSGAAPPPAVMSEAMRTVSSGLPLTYAVRVLQDPWLGLSVNLRDLAVMGAILLVAAAVSVRLFRSA